MTEDESRKAFEQWASSKRPPPALDESDRDEEGDYRAWDVQDEWNVWQAAIAWMQSQQAWRPMDSAPKDGTKILLCDGYEYCAALWDFGSWWEQSYREGRLDVSLTEWKGWLPLPPMPEEKG